MVTPTELEKKVERALNQNPKTKEFTIDVIEDSGLITLKGSVPSEEARVDVETLVLKQEGVLEVVNDVVVEPEDQEAEDTLPPPPLPTTG